MRKFIVFSGPAGAGKGTQAKLLAQRYGLVHVSTGDLFRDSIARQTDLGKRVKEIMARGELVEDTTTLEMVQERLAQSDCANGVVFDGFPRTGEQAKMLDALLAKSGEWVAAVVRLVVGNDIVLERLGGRRADDEGRIYHVKFNPPPAGVRVTQRDDDRPDAIGKRLAAFHKNELAVLRYHQKAKVININGEPPIAQVTAELFAKLSDLLAPIPA